MLFGCNALHIQMDHRISLSILFQCTEFSVLADVLDYQRIATTQDQDRELQQPIAYQPYFTRIAMKQYMQQDMIFKLPLSRVNREDLIQH
jgi:hypothetical protein